jgi:hypothetical protein
LPDGSARRYSLGAGPSGLTQGGRRDHRGRPGPDARVALRLGLEEIAIRLAGAGPPFNPLEAPPPDLEAPVAERPIGGLGLVLVRHIVEH